VLFPACPTPTEILTGLVANGIALSGGKTKFGCVYCTEAQGCLDADRIFSGGAVTNGGAKLVYRESISITQVDRRGRSRRRSDSSRRDAWRQRSFP
jgi:hypothetical protein